MYVCMYEQPHQTRNAGLARPMHLHFSLIIGWLLTLICTKGLQGAKGSLSHSSLSLCGVCVCGVCGVRVTGLAWFGHAKVCRQVGAWGGAAGGKAGNFVWRGRGFFWVDGWMDALMPFCPLIQGI